MKLNGTGQRWVNEFADFKFSLKYRPGKSHVDVDFMSRMQKDIVEYMKECTEVIPEEAVATSIVAIFNISVGKTSLISAMSDNLDNVKSEPFRDTTLDFKPLNSTTLLSAQKQDPAMAEILRYKALDGELTKDERMHETPAVKSLMREWKRLVVGKDEICVCTKKKTTPEDKSTN